MIETLREGIEGRKFKATLLVYVGSLLVLAPAAALIGFMWNYQKLLLITPVLVVILVGIEYAFCSPVTEEVLSRSLAKRRESTEHSPLKQGSALVFLTHFAGTVLTVLSLSVFFILGSLTIHLLGSQTSDLLGSLEITIFRLAFGVLVFCQVIEGLVRSLGRSKPNKERFHTEPDKPNKSGQ